MRKILLLAVLLAGCGGVDGLGDLGGGPDIARGPGYHPDLGGQDMAREATDMAQAVEPDMAHGDMAIAPTCNSPVPPCSPTQLPNGTYCCNGAQCINGTCWNPPGAYCCIASNCNPQVACWQSTGVASGVCGTNNRCM